MFYKFVTAVEIPPQILGRHQTVVTFLKTPNLTTRIRVLLRCSQPPRTGVCVMDMQILIIVFETSCVTTYALHNPPPWHHIVSLRPVNSTKCGLAVLEGGNPVCSSYLVGRTPSIPEAHDLSRSSSNASSFASVVEENETEAAEDYDTGMVSECPAHMSNA